MTTLSPQTSTKIKPDNSGSAYGRKPAHPDPVLAGVGPGTPCGEYLRRYWQPVAASGDVTTRPQMVRLLGEDLVLFRDKTGRPGLLYPRCMHRGTSLYYGKVEDEGIRCCYHGWMFDVEGNCLEQPCEPQGGLNRGVARQPWYPLEERYGLVFAYMGPLDRKPVLPRFDILEGLEEGEFINVDTSSIGVYQDFTNDPHAPYHWLQHWENVMDPYHVYVLHSTISGPQFEDDYAVMPSKVDFESIGNGVVYHTYRSFPDGREMDRVNCVILPNISALPNIKGTEGRSTMIGWHLAVDDTHFRWIFAAKNRAEFRPNKVHVHRTKSWSEMTDNERQDFPGDFEAQSSQGPVTLHSEEHLATSDRGVVMLRRLMRQQIQRVADGQDPAGVNFDEATATVKIPSGNFWKA